MGISYLQLIVYSYYSSHIIAINKEKALPRPSVMIRYKELQKENIL